MHVSVGARGLHIPTELKLQEAVRVLGTKLWSFTGAVSPLHHPSSLLLLLLLRKGLTDGWSSGWP